MPAQDVSSLWCAKMSQMLLTSPWAHGARQERIYARKRDHCSTKHLLKHRLVVLLIKSQAVRVACNVNRGGAAVKGRQRDVG